MLLSWLESHVSVSSVDNSDQYLIGDTLVTAWIAAAEAGSDRTIYSTGARVKDPSLQQDVGITGRSTYRSTIFLRFPLRGLRLRVEYLGRLMRAPAGHP